MNTQTHAWTGARRGAAHSRTLHVAAGFVLAALFVVLSACSGSEPEEVSVAILDDPSRDMYFHALNEGLVSSEEVDVEVTALTLGPLIEAVGSRQYDVVEGPGIALPRAASRGLNLVAISPSLVNEAGTYLFVAEESPIASPADLKGKVVGVPSLGGTFTLELRYLLKERFGLNVDMTDGDLRFQEVPAESLLSLLNRGQIDAGVAIHIPAHRLTSEPGVRVLSNVTKEVVELTGEPVINSVLMTYPEIADERREEVQAALELISDSATYAREHWNEVRDAVAEERGISSQFLDWWSERQQLELDKSMEERSEALVAVWQMAHEIGELPEVPSVEQFLF